MAPDDLQEHIGRAIRAWRKKLGLTLAQLAEGASVDTGFLGYIETGKKMPSLVTLAQIANALDMTLSELLKGVPSPRTPAQERAARQVSLLCSVSKPEHVEDVIAVLRSLRDRHKARALRQLLS